MNISSSDQKISPCLETSDGGWNERKEMWWWSGSFLGFAVSRTLTHASLSWHGTTQWPATVRPWSQPEFNTLYIKWQNQFPRVSVRQEAISGSNKVIDIPASSSLPDPHMHCHFPMKKLRVQRRRISLRQNVSSACRRLESNHPDWSGCRTQPLAPQRDCRSCTTSKRKESATSVQKMRLRYDSIVQARWSDSESKKFPRGNFNLTFPI